MYLIINHTKHTVSRRIVSADTIKYLSVTPAVEEPIGTIAMYRDDGFLMSEDNADSFKRKFMVGTVLTLTNEEEVVVEPTPEPELTPAELREQAYNTEAIIEWDGKYITVTEAATLWQYYAAEGSEKATELTALIAAAKATIREQYPDEEV